MKNTLLALAICLTALAIAQPNQAARDSLNRLTRQDFDETKAALGITTPNRPGPSGNPADENAANTDESKINEYTLPDPLVLKNGKAVTDLDTWNKKRKQELINDLESELYGKLPKNIPSVKWEVVYEKDTTVGKYPIKEKLLKGVVDNSSYPDISVEIELLVATPAEATEAVPLVLHFGWINSPWGPPQPEPTSFLFSSNEPGWQSQLISTGWGYAIIVPGSVQADNGAGLKSGIIGLVNKGKLRKGDDWGSLRAWAWGASRAVDYFETDNDVDASRLAIEGLSRYGKAALVTMAFEPRFSLGYIGSSGAGGAKILRRNIGEQVENLAGSGEYHWFCGNFIRYASEKTVHDLPVDAHSLVAICAPRPVFISVGSPKEEGQWVDAKGMFLAGVHASPVYELHGKKGLGTDDFPMIGYPLIEGDLAYRQHAGGHSTGPNWSTWIAWACRYWGDCRYD